MMLYKLKLAACFGIPEASGTCIISLVDESEKRALSITTTEYVAEQLSEYYFLPLMILSFIIFCIPLWGILNIV